MLPIKGGATVAIISVMLPLSAQANCQSAIAQDVLAHLITESEVRNYLSTGCSDMMTRHFMPRVIARRNEARMQTERGNASETVPGYQLQYRHRGKWVAGPTFLKQWDCADAKWTPGVIGARCVEVRVQVVE